MSEFGSCSCCGKAPVGRGLDPPRRRQVPTAGERRYRPSQARDRLGRGGAVVFGDSRRSGQLSDCRDPLSYQAPGHVVGGRAMLAGDQLWATARGLAGRGACYPGAARGPEAVLEQPASGYAPRNAGRVCPSAACDRAVSSPRPKPRRSMLPAVPREVDLWLRHQAIL